MRIGIVGLGVVGRAVQALFADFPVYTYDPEVDLPTDSKDDINRCDIVFVCVPTPKLPEGSCDLSIVKEVVTWISERALIVIRSTVVPGTTEWLAERTGKAIVFQPEYLGETASHPYRKMENTSFIILGGEPVDTARVLDLYKQVYDSSVRVYLCNAATAEMAKYMTNAFLATKVEFCNEFYDAAQALGVDYNTLREVWLADERIGRSHTFVHEHDRGFAGKCLPKDLSAIIHRAQGSGAEMPLLETVLQTNARRRDK